MTCRLVHEVMDQWGSIVTDTSGQRCVTDGREQVILTSLGSRVVYIVNNCLSVKAWFLFDPFLKVSFIPNLFGAFLSKIFILNFNINR